MARHASLIALGLSALVIGAVASTYRRKPLAAPTPPPTPLQPGSVVVVPMRALPTELGRLLSSPPVQLGIGTMGGNVHIAVRVVESAARASGVVVGIDSYNDTPPFNTSVSPVASRPTISFDPTTVIGMSDQPAVGGRVWGRLQTPPHLASRAITDRLGYGRPPPTTTGCAPCALQRQQ